MAVGWKRTHDCRVGKNGDQGFLELDVEPIISCKTTNIVRYSHNIMYIRGLTLVADFRCRMTT